MAVFVELKTEGLSRRPEQDKYLLAAQKIGLASLAERTARHIQSDELKAQILLQPTEHLEYMGLMHISISMKEIMKRSTLQGANGASKQMRSGLPRPSLLSCTSNQLVSGRESSFHEFAEVVQA